jgi:hypothetical protein
MLLLTLESAAVGEEQRAAQRIDLTEPVSAKVGDVAAKIVDISLVGCRVEHAEKLTMGATPSLSFQWRDEPVRIAVKVTRTELRSASGKMMYSTGLQFATSVDTSPEAVRRIMASLVKTNVTEHPPAEVPIFFERAPFLRDEEKEEPLPPARASAQVAAPTPFRGGAIALPAEHVDTNSSSFELDYSPAATATNSSSFELDYSPAATATHIDAHAETAIATRSFELEGDEIATAVEEHHEDAAAQSFELHVETPQQFARCTFEDGKWKVTITTEPKQPRDGFTIVDPGDQGEVDQYCRTYEYADPDTRRMIRVSCELMIAQQRSH